MVLELRWGDDWVNVIVMMDWNKRAIEHDLYMRSLHQNENWSTICLPSPLFLEVTVDHDFSYSHSWKSRCSTTWLEPGQPSITHDTHNKPSHKSAFVRMWKRLCAHNIGMAYRQFQFCQSYSIGRVGKACKLWKKCLPLPLRINPKSQHSPWRVIEKEA